MAPVSSRFCSKGKYLKCNECNKTFNSKIGLDLHARHHTGQYSTSVVSAGKVLSLCQITSCTCEDMKAKVTHVNTVVKCSSLHSSNSTTNLNILEITGSLVKLVAKDLIEKGFILNILLHTNSLAFVRAVL